MLAWVVIDRRHHRLAAPFALPFPTPLFPLPHLSPLLPYSYGHSYTTATHQPLCNQSVTHSFDLHGGCTLLAVSTAHPPLPIPYLSRAKRVLCAPDGFTEPTEGSDLVGRDPFSCHTPAHTFALFCAFLHAPKIQLVSFQAFPHSLQKTPGGGYRVCVGSQFLRVATTTYCEQVFGLTQFLAMTRSCDTDSVPPTSFWEEKMKPRIVNSAFLSARCARWSSCLQSGAGPTTLLSRSKRRVTSWLISNPNLSRWVLSGMSRFFSPPLATKPRTRWSPKSAGMTPRSRADRCRSIPFRISSANPGEW